MMLWLTWPKTETIHFTVNECATELLKHWISLYYIGFFITFQHLCLNWRASKIAVGKYNLGHLPSGQEEKS